MHVININSVFPHYSYHYIGVRRYCTTCMLLILIVYSPTIIIIILVEGDTVPHVCY